MSKMMSAEEFATHKWPVGYYNDTVCNGYKKPNSDKPHMIYIQLIHIVKPNGEMSCNCPIDPEVVYNFTAVAIPDDYKELLCENSELYLRRIAYHQRRKG